MRLLLTDVLYLALLTLMLWSWSPSLILLDDLLLLLMSLLGLGTSMIMCVPVSVLGKVNSGLKSLLAFRIVFDYKSSTGGKSRI